MDGSPTTAQALEASRLFSGLPRAGEARHDDLLKFLEANRSASLAALPWLAAELAGHEGFEAMIAFLHARGGRRIYLADGADAERVLGLRVADRTHARIVDGAGAGRLVDAPSAWGAFVALRRVAIDRALADGASPADVAAAFGVTRRSLRA